VGGRKRGRKEKSQQKEGKEGGEKKKEKNSGLPSPAFHIVRREFLGKTGRRKKGGEKNNSLEEKKEIEY